MSTYSYSGNTYTDKSSGDTIDESHVNDLQDEVEIVEGVITGGTEGQVLTADATGKAGWEDASGGGGFQPVPVNSDWSVADNIWTDIQAATGIAGRVAAGGSPAIIEISLWEGDADSDDYALIAVVNNSPICPYQFASAPASGTAYIVGIAYLIFEMG